ncbi:redox-sensitive transcriptional activator SoxR [Actibacterium pelagium]|uniref:redox-sensitive transcriptional activator SoxR n=1 Tax=Actibacterium pelagium TaxID=2029103 RepID=UPI00227CBD5C|nr:redox-sensitive transcriptional activator SoxR [Actibacterium pelagium]
MKNSRVEKRGLTIGQMSERTGLATSAIRFYEEQGLVHPFRTDTGQRRYDRADLRRLSFIMISQGLGFSIAQIRESLSKLPENRTPTKADWTRLSKGFQQELDARIEQMQALRERLDGCIGCGCLSLKKCTLYNPRDRARQKGAGPRYVMGDSPD